MKYLLIIVVLICQLNVSLAANDNTLQSKYLLKPSGKYHVGFKDFHFINTKVCPDPYYDKNNKDDFDADNKSYCHEIMVRIYYPSNNNKSQNSTYDKLILAYIKQEFENHYHSKLPINELTKIKSYSQKNIQPVLTKKFPVILFSPGNGSPIQIYENIICDLVSHGYVVVGINSVFISGDVELPNKHKVKFGLNQNEADLIKLMSADLYFVYDKIIHRHISDALIKMMDLNHIGLLGQSLGGEIVANAAHFHAKDFQAAATLDSGIEEKDDTLKTFTIPFLREISANRKLELSREQNFQLGIKDYLITISPSRENHNYSGHLNFTDYSTLQYLPAFQAALNIQKKLGIKTMLGEGNGWVIAKSINAYLLQFFDFYLKGKNSDLFEHCKSHIKNTLLECGSTP